MNSLPILAAAFGLAAALGAAERAALAAARRGLAIRIQVNGTRGKSTTTRLIRAALAEDGIACLSKSTGTAARYVLPDGREEAVRRRAAPNVREQIAAVLRAWREKATALVVECMALKPELQWASERLILRSTIGVITNARLDHVETMGRDRAEIARSLGNTIPERGILVVGEAFLAE
ncbi:MAG: hypothetical protein JNG85_15860, partial [Spirochaetaceae bacterium]|nr:hypothetical protein [Spirochaetaceae bacterium]